MFCVPSCFSVGSNIIKSISILLYVNPFFYPYSTCSLLIGHNVNLEPISEAEMLGHSKHREDRSDTVHLVLFFLHHLASVILQLLMFSFFAIIFADFPVCRAPSAAVKQENKTKHYVCMSNGQIVAGNKMERHHFLCFWCPLSFLSLCLPLSLCLSLSQAPCADTQELLMLKCGITSAKAGITLKGCP